MIRQAAARVSARISDAFMTALLKKPRDSLFHLLWLVYFASNLGRFSYTACMIEIINREGLSPVSAGLVVTGFFICYGISQIVSGFIGGRTNPRKLIFIGLFCTALANLAMGFSFNSSFMVAVWCFNGFIQSIIWPPILRIIVEYYSEPWRSKACANISTTYPVAVMFAYLSCAGIITVLPWRAVFFIYALFLFAVSRIWLLAFKAITLAVAPNENGFSEKALSPQTKKHLASSSKKMPALALFLFCLALISQGALRDGLMTWIPAYTTRMFLLTSNTAILSAGILPLFNLAGIYVSRLILKHTKDEAKTAVYLFGASCMAILILRFFGEYHILLSLSAFAVITGSMMGVNLMLVCMVPARFSEFGLVSFLTGLTNSMVYLGSSVSTFGIAAMLERTGWEWLLILLAALAMVSALFCVWAVPRWAVFIGKTEQGKGLSAK
jgi:OPA family glycerol-3-phosphate transporter-like MFS transporter